MHVSDWLPTVIEGIFGFKLDHADEFTTASSAASVRPLDGFNVWSAIATGGASPRTEVISQVSNGFFNTSTEGKGETRGKFRHTAAAVSLIALDVWAVVSLSVLQVAWLSVQDP